MINTYLSHQMVKKVSKNLANTRVKPKSVLEYNPTLGGVNELDKRIKPYQSHRKTVKWYIEVFFHLFDIAVYNTYILHTKVASQNEISYLNFLNRLIEEILSINKLIRSKKGRPTKILKLSTVRLTGYHAPSKILKPNGKVKHSDCHLCMLNGKRKATSFVCTECDKRLCIGSNESNCFHKYHCMPSLPKKRKIAAMSSGQENSVDSRTSSELMAAQMENYLYFNA